MLYNLAEDVFNAGENEHLSVFLLKIILVQQLHPINEVIFCFLIHEKEMIEGYTNC